MPGVWGDIRSEVARGGLRISRPTDRRSQYLAELAFRAYPVLTIPAPTPAVFS